MYVDLSLNSNVRKHFFTNHQCKGTPPILTTVSGPFTGGISPLTTNLGDSIFTDHQCKRTPPILTTVSGPFKGGISPLTTNVMWTPSSLTTKTRNIISKHRIPVDLARNYVSLLLLVASKESNENRIFVDHVVQTINLIDVMEISEGRQQASAPHAFHRLGFVLFVRCRSLVRMGAIVAAIFLYLVMSGSCYLHSPVRNDQERNEERVRRQLATSGSTYEYVFYTDILMEGYGSSAAESRLRNTSLLPYTLPINSSISVTVVQIEITTECNVTDTGKMCTCSPGYSWNITVCYTYPPCSNSSNFCSCLFIQDDIIPFFDLKGSLTMNETFTADLLDTTSPKYQAMQSNITLALLNAYAKNCNPLSVAVHGFSPGSVIANYKMSLSGLVTATQLKATNTLVAQSLSSVISSQLSTAGVVTIQPTYLEVKFEDPIQLLCHINGTMTFVNWTLTTANVTNMVFGAGGNVHVSTQQLSGSTVSVLTIAKANQWWKGTYACQFSNDSLVHEAMAVVNVSFLPIEITINPLQKSLTAQDRSRLQLECCVPYDDENYNVTWTYDNVALAALPVWGTFSRCYTLVPPRPTNDTNYTCTFINKAGQQKSNSISVTVIQAADLYCSVNVSGGVIWNVTRAGMSASAVCPLGKSGFVTRDCSTDGVWLSVQDNCISEQIQAALNSVQALEQGLGNAQVKVPDIIQQMSNSSGTFVSNEAEVSAVVNILGSISNIAASQNSTFDTRVVTKFLTLASNLTDPGCSSLWRSSKSPPASKVLQSVETFSQLLKTENESFEIDLENIHLKGSFFEQGRVGEDYAKTFALHLGVSMSIDKQTISSLLKQQDFKITSVVFSTIGNLLPSMFGKSNDSQLNSIVQTTSIKLSDSSYVSSNIQMSFIVNTSEARYSQHCVFWDFSLPGIGGSWSDAGCTSRVDTNTTFCSCSHLTSFAVLMSINVEPLMLIEEITYAGLGVSILSLCICIFIEGFVWKTVTRTNISYFRHISLINIAVSLLCADVFFLSSAFPLVITKHLICLSITFLNHFFYLALFFWTFAQSVMLLHQLLFVFHHLRKTVFVSLSFTAGYFFPAVIAAGTLLYYYPKGKYRHEKLCWLNPESGAIYAFAVPAGSIIMFNFLTLLVVIAKLSRPSVSEATQPDERETAKSIMKAVVVLTPVFGLTWAFGFALLTDLDNMTRQVFTYGFAGMNAFQGFFIFLTCITEKKVREVLFNKRSLAKTSTATTMSSSEAPSKTR
ncbi:PREDICTED: adhesion G-protein coupled receptor F3 [Nanorana parkeri]|uniref:adhesion G-protein coupled receptor F3 n=1 Tax=Nanorana parkeri TaxID=125878 RepID=UPI000854C5F0|nr:PREDICTED: adhesion G-protein coupled receptor F3 [Nanorana parkeri]